VVSLTDSILSLPINHFMFRSVLLAMVAAERFGSRPQQFEAGTTLASRRTQKFWGYRNSGKRLAIR
jgi:hypothetical protein